MQNYPENDQIFCLSPILSKTRNSKCVWAQISLKTIYFFIVVNIIVFLQKPVAIFRIHIEYESKSKKRPLACMKIAEYLFSEIQCGSAWRGETETGIWFDVIPNCLKSSLTWFSMPWLWHILLFWTNEYKIPITAGQLDPIRLNNKF